MIRVTTVWLKYTFEASETVTSAPLGPLATQGTSEEAPAAVLVACLLHQQPAPAATPPGPIQ